MSAVLKATGVLATIGAAGCATAWSMQQSSTDFSKNALVAAEHSASEVTSAVKPKLCVDPFCS